MRFFGRIVALVATATLVGTACSGDGDGDRGSGATTTTTTVTSLDPTTTVAVSGSSTTRAVTATTLAAGATTTAPAPTTGPATTTAPATTVPGGGGPLIATAGGWRMVITQPTGGSTIGSVAVLCYEVTGSSREAAVGFEVTFLQPGTTTAAGTFRADVALGRGTVRIPITGVPSGRYDLRIQLLLEGARLDGAVVATTVNVVAGGAQGAAC